ncbi:MAG: hypothetical protein FJ295_08035 [Planctomycetes bacterium]|nr:hypothetical protein [Planctomycetota bacterium]
MTNESAMPVDPRKLELVRELGHDRPLTACHWEPGSRFLYCGAEDNLVHRWELASGTRTAMAAHDSWVRAFASSPNGEFLYTGGYDGRLITWSAAAENPVPLRAIEAHDGWIRALAISGDGRYLASCGNDRQINIWDAASGARLQSLRGHTTHVYQLIYAKDARRIFSCDLRGVVFEWTVESGVGRELVTVKALHEYDTTFRADIGGARCVAARSDGEQIALGGISNVSNAFAGIGEIVVALLNSQSGKIDQVLQAKDKTQGTTWGVAHHPDGFWIGVSGGAGRGWLYFWKGDESHEFHRVELKHDGRGMSLSPDRRQLAVAHADMQLRIYAIGGP